MGGLPQEKRLIHWIFYSKQGWKDESKTNCYIYDSI